MKKVFLFLSLFALIVCGVFAQPNQNPIGRTTRVQASSDSMLHRVVPIPEPMDTVTGQLTYLWWFGDNYFSFEPEPTHHYREVHGTSHMRAVITENYSNSGPPPCACAVPLQPIVPNQISNSAKILDEGEGLRIQHYRHAVPNDTLYLLVTYASDSSIFSGERSIKISIDPQFASNFTMLPQQQSGYLPNQEYLTGVLEWNVFLDPNKLDRSMLIPLAVNQQLENFYFTPIFVHCEMTQEGGQGRVVVASDDLTFSVLRSHDPNMMLVEEQERTNCKIKKSEELNYTVHFQNIGEGPTDSVKVKTYVDERLDVNEVEVEGFHRPIPLCTSAQGCDPVELWYTMKVDPDSNLITWSFNKLILLGSSQPDCSDLEKTKGFVSFTIKPKQTFSIGNDVVCKSLIYFDDNAPIWTNEAVVTCSDPKPVNPSPIHSCLLPWILVLILLLLVIILLLRGRKRKQ